MSEPCEIARLDVMLDMAGCPNRCRHCWLGRHRNGSMTADAFCDIAGQFKNWRDENGRKIPELGFFSWWREPDYREDYRALWELEQTLSSPGRARRFELLSTWRLARDESYAPWAAAIGTKVCQITFFGMHESTDWAMQRRGGFEDQLLATQRCLQAGIVPRWQLFPLKRSLGELPAFLRLIGELKLHARCAAIGGQFEMFLNSASPEGCGYELEGERLTQGDLAHIPAELARMSRDGLCGLGEPEAALLPRLIEDAAPPRMGQGLCALAIDADYDVYPNIAEPAPWWRLGNLRQEGVDAILRAYRQGTAPGMAANNTIPLGELARRYGDPKADKLYAKSDLIARFMHQWGEDERKGKNNV